MCIFLLWIQIKMDTYYWTLSYLSLKYPVVLSWRCNTCCCPRTKYDGRLCFHRRLSVCLSVPDPFSSLWSHVLSWGTRVLSQVLPWDYPSHVKGPALEGLPQDMGTPWLGLVYPTNCLGQGNPPQAKTGLTPLDWLQSSQYAFCGFLQEDFLVELLLLLNMLTIN